MTETPNLRLRWSARLMLAGLAVELISLFGLKHPWGFLLFSTGGVGLMAIGVLLYLSHRLGPSS